MGFNAIAKKRLSLNLVFLGVLLWAVFASSNSFADVQQARGQTSQALQQVSQLEQRVAQLQAWCSANCSGLTPDSQQRLQAYIQTLQQGATATRNDLQQVLSMQDQSLQQGINLDWQARTEALQTVVASRLPQVISVCDPSGNCASGSGVTSTGTASTGACGEGPCKGHGFYAPSGTFGFGFGNTSSGSGSMGQLGGLLGAMGSLLSSVCGLIGSLPR